MMSALKIAVAGAGGRMGRTLLSCVLRDPSLILHSAIVRPGSSLVGRDVGELTSMSFQGILMTDDMDAAVQEADVILDFTEPATTFALLDCAESMGLVHIVGTTGFTKQQLSGFDSIARARVVRSGNLSTGVAFLYSLVKSAAASLGADWSVDIVEMHHRHKIDAPSGTALMLGEAVAGGRAASQLETETHYASLRGGSVIGEHSVVFFTPYESITLQHKATDRGLFAAGAIKAAQWAHSQPPGHYNMLDVVRELTP